MKALRQERGTLVKLIRRRLSDKERIRLYKKLAILLVKAQVSTFIVTKEKERRVKPFLHKLK